MKLWKIRARAFEDLGELFDSDANQEDYPILATIPQSFPKMASDSHEMSQRAAIDAICKYMQRVNRAGSDTPEGQWKSMVEPLVDVLVEKAIPSKGGSAFGMGAHAKRKAPASKCKAEAMETLHLLMGSGTSEQVQARLLNTVKTNKLPKVVATAVEIYRLLLHEYGTSVLAPKPIAVEMAHLLNHKEGNVRKESLKLCIELYRWLRQSLLPMLEKHKKAAGVVETVDGGMSSVDKSITLLIKSLDPYFQRVDEEPMPEPLRQVVDATPCDGGDNIALTTTPLKMAMDEMLMVDDEVDIMAMLTPEWFHSLEAEKWKERKEALDSLVKLADRPCLMSGDYSMLSHKLISIIQDDRNVNVVAVAIQAVGLLSHGLKESFLEHAKALFPSVLNRLKDKKDLVLDACQIALQHMCRTMALPEAWRFLEPGAKSKAPKIRQKCLEMVQDYIMRTEEAKGTIPERSAARIAALLVSTSADTQAAVRDAAATAFGALVYSVGVESLEDSLRKLDNQKSSKHFKAKINEFLESKGCPPLKGNAPPAKAAETTKQPARKQRRSSIDASKTKVGASKAAEAEGSGPPANSTNLSRNNSTSSTASASSSDSKARKVHVAIDCTGVPVPEKSPDDMMATQELYQIMKKAKYNSQEEALAREKHNEGQVWEADEQGALLGELQRLREAVRSSECKLRQRDSQLQQREQQIDSLCAQVAVKKMNAPSSSSSGAGPQAVEAAQKPARKAAVVPEAAAPAPAAAGEPAPVKVAPVKAAPKVAEPARKKVAQEEREPGATGALAELEMVLKVPVGTPKQAQAAAARCEAALQCLEAFRTHAGELGVGRAMLARVVAQGTQGEDVAVGGDGLYGYAGDNTGLLEQLEPDVREQLTSGMASLRGLLRIKVADEGDFDHAASILRSGLPVLASHGRGPTPSALRQPKPPPPRVSKPKEKVDPPPAVEPVASEEEKPRSQPEPVPELAEDDVSPTSGVGVGALRTLKKRRSSLSGKREKSREGSARSRGSSRESLRAQVAETRVSEADLLRAQIAKLKEAKAAMVAEEDFDGAARVKNQVSALEAALAGTLAKQQEEQAKAQEAAQQPTVSEQPNAEQPVPSEAAVQHSAAVEQAEPAPQGEQQDSEREAQPIAEPADKKRHDARAHSRGFRDFRAKSASGAMPPEACTFKIGERVVHLASKEEGTVAWCGSSDALPQGLWVGVVLDMAAGRNDGEVKGQRLFECAPNHGVVSRTSGLMALALPASENNSAPAVSENSNAPAAVSESDPPPAAAEASSSSDGASADVAMLEEEGSAELSSQLQREQVAAVEADAEMRNLELLGEGESELAEAAMVDVAETQEALRIALSNTDDSLMSRESEVEGSQELAYTEEAEASHDSLGATREAPQSEESLAGRIAGMEFAVEAAIAARDWNRCQALQNEINVLRQNSDESGESSLPDIASAPHTPAEKTMNGRGSARGVGAPKWGDWRKETTAEAPKESPKKRSKAPKVKTMFPNIEATKPAEESPVCDSPTAA